MYFGEFRSDFLSELSSATNLKSAILAQKAAISDLSRINSPALSIQARTSFNAINGPTKRPGLFKDLASSASGINDAANRVTRINRTASSIARPLPRLADFGQPVMKAFLRDLTLSASVYAAKHNDINRSTRSSLEGLSSAAGRGSLAATYKKPLGTFLKSNASFLASYHQSLDGLLAAGSVDLDGAQEVFDTLVAAAVRQEASDSTSSDSVTTLATVQDMWKTVPLIFFAIIMACYISEQREDFDIAPATILLGVIGAWEAANKMSTWTLKWTEWKPRQ